MSYEDDRNKAAGNIFGTSVYHNEGIFDCAKEMADWGKDWAQKTSYKEQRDNYYTELAGYHGLEAAKLRADRLALERDAYEKSEFKEKTKGAKLLEAVQKLADSEVAWSHTIRTEIADAAIKEYKQD